MEAFDVPVPDFDFPGSYNIAPGRPIPIVAEDRRGRRMGLMPWGLVPNWQDEPGRPFNNARSESAAAKPSFSDAIRGRRCLVPADGFYEWRREGGAKVPHWFHRPDGGLLAFAGIWDRWSRPGAEPRFGVAILTADANHDVRSVHHRMPVIVDPAEYGAWLGAGTEWARVEALLRPAPDGTLASHPVSSRVNRTTEDDAGLIESV